MSCSNNSLFNSGDEIMRRKCAEIITVTYLGIERLIHNLTLSCNTLRIPWRDDLKNWTHTKVRQNLALSLELIMNGTSMFVGSHKTGVLRVLQAVPMARRDPVDGHARVQLALLGVQFGGGGCRVNSGVR